MATNHDAVLKDALSLSPADRAALIDELLVSLDHSDPELERLWAREAERRIAAVERGEMETYDAEEVMEELGTHARQVHRGRP